MVRRDRDRGFGFDSRVITIALTVVTVAVLIGISIGGFSVRSDASRSEGPQFGLSALRIVGCGERDDSVLEYQLTVDNSSPTEGSADYVQWAFRVTGSGGDVLDLETVRGADRPVRAVDYQLDSAGWGPAPSLQLEALDGPLAGEIVVIERGLSPVGRTEGCEYPRVGPQQVISYGTDLTVVEVVCSADGSGWEVSLEGSAYLWDQSTEEGGPVPNGPLSFGYVGSDRSTDDQVVETATRRDALRFVAVATFSGVQAPAEFTAAAAPRPDAFVNGTVYGGSDTATLLWSPAEEDAGTCPGADAPVDDGPGPACRRNAPPSDFDGDDLPDLLIPVAGESVGDRVSAGVVHVLFSRNRRADSGPVEVIGGDDSLTITKHSLGFEPGLLDRFGEAFVLADVTGNGCDDLVIGAPGDSDQAGAVYVLPRDANGFRFDDAEVLRQGEGGLPGGAEEGDRFGASLAAGGTDATGRWLAIGAPGEDIGSVRDAGAVVLIGLQPDGSRRSWFISQETDGISGSAEAGDQFGASLAAVGGADGVVDLAVGVPFEDLGSVIDAGNVHVLAAEPNEGRRSYPGDAGDIVLNQNDGSADEEAEFDDRFGQRLVAVDAGNGAWDLAIGVPHEDVGEQTDAGLVHLLNEGEDGFADASWQSITQSSPGVPGGSERFDLFGDGLGAPRGFDDGASAALIIGIRGEDEGSIRDSGSVLVVPLASGLFGNTVLLNEDSYRINQGTPGFGGVQERDDQFGAGVHTFGGNILIGSPGEDLGEVDGAGVVHFIPSPSGTDAPDWRATVSIHQDTRGVGGQAEEGDGFGGGTSQI